MMNYIQNVNFSVYGCLFKDVWYMDLENILYKNKEKFYFINY